MARRHDGKTKIDRRQLLGLAAGATSTLLLAPSGLLVPRASAQTEASPDGKFLLYIHFGSACGWSSGLLQPRDVDIWQRGIFWRGEQGESVNPLVNRHFKSGHLVFHDYSKVLEPIASDLCFAAGVAEAHDHDGAWLQRTTGAGAGSPNASWVVGFAEAMHRGGEPSSLVASLDQLTFTEQTANVAMARATNYNDFLTTALRDVGGLALMGTPHAERIAKVFAATQRSAPHPAHIPSQIRSATAATMLRHTANAPSIVDNETWTAINGALSDQRVLDVLEAAATSEGADIQTMNKGFMGELRLAAALIKGGKARGMSVRFDGPDSHTGGTSVTTARLAALLWTELVVFWQWVKAERLDDKVMVIVSHDFGRSSYNGQTTYDQVRVDGQTIYVPRSPGTDHATTMGMLFLNKNVPSASRVGAITDHNVPVGSAKLDGIPTPELAPYRSIDLVPMMLMRSFPKEFPNVEAVRRYWPTFTEHQQLSRLLLT